MVSPSPPRLHKGVAIPKRLRICAQTHVSCVSTTSWGNSERVVRPEIDKLPARLSSWAAFKDKAKRRAPESPVTDQTHTRGSDGIERASGPTSRVRVSTPPPHGESACVLDRLWGDTRAHARTLAAPQLHLVSLSLRPRKLEYECSVMTVVAFKEVAAGKI